MKDNNRILGSYTCNKDGPLLFITAAIHGNEPSGVHALQRVFKILHAQKPLIAGTIVGVIGNVAALQQGVRFIDEDLNRTWTRENIQLKDKSSNEKQQMFEIIETLQQFSAKHQQRYFIDCHTTSSSSLPYISVQEVGKNDAFAHQFPIHIIRGFSDIVNGTIDGYLSTQGITGFTVEAGQHESSDSEAYHEGIIWIALQEVCKLNFNALKNIPSAVIKTRNETPPQKTFKILHRFGLKEDDTFKMKPGFENFQPIQKGENLATLNGTQVNSDWDNYIFMPLYQPQGNDGFFVVEAD